MCGRKDRFEKGPGAVHKLLLSRWRQCWLATVTRIAQFASSVDILLPTSRMASIFFIGRLLSDKGKNFWIEDLFKMFYVPD